jgi:hypothetical protein
VVWPLSSPQNKYNGFLGVHQIYHQSFGLPFLLSEQVDETCCANVAAESLPVAGPTNPEIGPSSPDPAPCYGYFVHALDEAFL